MKTADAMRIGIWWSFTDLHRRYPKPGQVVMNMRPEERAALKRLKSDDPLPVRLEDVFGRNPPQRMRRSAIRLGR